MLRYRGSKAALTQVKELDAFPKIPESYAETSVSGGALSICTFVLIFILVIFEIIFFFDSKLKFKYEVDIEYDEKVWLNFDITVATDCKLIGADVVDTTGQAWLFNEEIVEENIPFALSQKEASIRDSLLQVKDKLLSEGDGTKLSEIAIKHGFNATQMYFQKHPASNEGKVDSCRFYGNLLINKVSGNFHITAGKSIPLRGGHAHLSFISNDLFYNFSHRINHFSFGDMKVGFINVLDGDEHLTEHQNAIFHYYVNAVSTRINSRRLKTKTYQFSVSEQARLLDHASGSHGMTGIFFKYSFSPLAVTIDEKTIPFGRLFVRLCGIIGGIFATSSIVNLLFGVFMDAYGKKNTLSDGIHAPKRESSINPEEKVTLLNNPILSSNVVSS